MSVQAFKGITKDLVFFATRTHLTTGETEALLWQRRRELVSATTYRLDKLVRDAVSVHKKRVDACKGGCVAFTGEYKWDNKCWKCGEDRYSSARKPAKQVEYFSLIAWLEAILADPVLGPEMVATMKAARQAAASNDRNHPYADFYHGENYRKIARQRLLCFGTRLCHQPLDGRV